MQENSWRPELCPGLCWGAYSAPTVPLADGNGWLTHPTNPAPTLIIIRRRTKFSLTLTQSSIKHESEARAVARWPNGVCNELR